MIKTKKTKTTGDTCTLPRSDDGSILLATLDHPHDAPELLIHTEFLNEGSEGQRRSPIRYIGVARELSDRNSIFRTRGNSGMASDQKQQRKPAYCDTEQRLLHSLV